MPKGYGQANQTKTAEGEKRWRDKVTKYARLSVTICQISGYSIKPVARCDIKLARDQRLIVQTNDGTLSWEQVHLEMKGKDYEVKEGKK